MWGRMYGVVVDYVWRGLFLLCYVCLALGEEWVAAGDGVCCAQI